MYYSERGILDLARAITASLTSFQGRHFCFVTIDNGQATQHADYELTAPPIITGKWREEVVVFTVRHPKSGMQTFVWRAVPQANEPNEIVGVTTREPIAI